MTLVREKPFVLLGPETFFEIEDFQTSLLLIDGRVTHVTNVAETVRSFLDAMGILDVIGVYRGVGVFKLRFDLWVVMLHETPISVIDLMYASPSK